MCYGPSAATYYHSDGVDSSSTSTLASIFLGLVLLLTAVLASLPDSASVFGLFGTLREQGLMPTELFRGFVACTVLFGALSLAFWLHNATDPQFAFEGWPRGAVRRIAWLQIFSLAVLGFCLSYLDLKIFVFITGIGLLLLLHKARSRHPGIASWNTLSRALWSVRWCWLVAIFFSQQSTLPNLSKEYELLALLGLLLGLITQAVPRLSFAYCFFVADISAQVSFERHLWVTRIERTLVCLALGIWWLVVGEVREQLAVHLAIFCFSRWFYFLILAEILKLPGWQEAVFSELGPYIDGKNKVLPDRRSLDDHYGPRSEVLLPKDQVGDGDLYVPLEQPPSKVPARTGIIPIEAVAGGLLLLLCLACASKLQVGSATSVPIDHYAVRVIDSGAGSTLLIPVSHPGLQKLCDTAAWRQLHVQTSVDDRLGLIFLLGFFLVIWSRWGPTIRAAWGGKDGKSSEQLRSIALGWLGTITVGTLWGWFWFPSTLALAILVFSYYISASGKIAFWNLERLWHQLRMLYLPPSPKGKNTDSVPNKVKDLDEQVVLRPLSLVVGKSANQKFTHGQTVAFPSQIVGEMERLIGVEYSGIFVEQSNLLEQDEWQFKIRNLQASAGRFGEGDLDVELFAEKLFSAAVPHLHLLINRSHTSLVLRKAYSEQPSLTKRVIEHFSLGELRLQLRALVRQSFPLAEHSAWMRQLLRNNQKS